MMYQIAAYNQVLSAVQPIMDPFEVFGNTSKYGAVLFIFSSIKMAASLKQRNLSNLDIKNLK